MLAYRSCDVGRCFFVVNSFFAWGWEGERLRRTSCETGRSRKHMQAGHAISGGAAGRRREEEKRERKGLQRTMSPIAVVWCIQFVHFSSLLLM